jgi:preprotein translocase subunit SecB
VVDKPSAGYRLERVYVSQQDYAVVEATDVPEGTDPQNRPVQFGWDWRPISPKRFEVVIDVRVGPTKATPEKAFVRLLGIFQAPESEDPGLPFLVFVRQNGPAILFPYAREVVSTMTGRGPYGSFHINPINVVALLAKVPMADTTGYRFLEENAAVAETFGLTYRETAGKP